MKITAISCGLLVVLVCVTKSSVCNGQSLGLQSVEQLRDSPVAANLIRLIHHINSESSTSKEDLKLMFAKDLLDRIGHSALLDAFGEIRESDGQWEVFDVNRTQEFRFALKAKGTRHGEWLDIVLKVEVKAPHRIIAIEGIETTQVGAKSSKPMFAPKLVREHARKTPVVNKEKIDQLDKWLKQEERNNQFSGVVLLAKDYQTVFHKAYGLASRRYNVPVRLDTKFRLASVNKIFTAVAILQLIEQGKLSFDDKMVKFIDGFSDPRTSEITVRHLLSHSSGWQAYWEHPEYLKNRSKLRSVNDYMRFIKTIPLDFEPGQRMQYSNTGYNVLGAIIEKVSGNNYYDHIQKFVFEPAGMTSSVSHSVDEIAPNLATGYTNFDINHKRTGEGFSFENTLISSVKGTPAGGGCSTAHDLLKFVQAVDQNIIVNQSSEEFLRHDIGVRKKISPFIFHNGGGPGQNTWMQADVDNGYTVIVLCNLDPPIGSNVVKKMGEIFNLPIW